MEKMKIFGLMVFLLAALAAPAQTNQGWRICRNPVRVFPGQATVDLTPLFQWWARQPLVVTNGATRHGDITNSPEEARPLTGWFRVTGRKVGATFSGWVVDATIYTSPTVHSNSRVLLKNPPAVEEAQFDALKAQGDEAEREIADRQRVYKTDTNAEARAQAEVEAYRRSRSKIASDGVIAYTRLAIEKHDAAAAALNQIDQLEAARRQITAQMRMFPSMGGFYQVDWFAVRRGQTKQGLPIYDLGLVSPTPP
jgi:hypothetical protein